jgi:RyR domain-containing protein
MMNYSQSLRTDLLSNFKHEIGSYKRLPILFMASTFTVNDVARICHQTNKAYCELLGDNSQKDWDEAEEWQRESAIKGVQFRIDNPDAPESAQHDAWMKDKVEAGWVYGEEKNSELKTHHCIVPFDQLPETQQRKDKLFCAVVDAMLK